MKKRIRGRSMTARRLFLCILMTILTVSFSFAAFDEIAYAAGTNPTQAGSLTYGKDAFGTITISRDWEKPSHYYKFKTDSIKGVNYTVRATYTDAKQSKAGLRDLQVTILDDNYDAICADGTKGSAVSAYSGRLYYVGDVASETFKNLKPNSTYYVRIQTGEMFYKGDKVSYAVCAKKTIVRPGAPAIQSLKAGKKGSGKFTVKYNKKSYASRYQIQLKKAGGSWRTFNNGTKLSRTFKKAHKDKYYYVRVRAQRKVGGKWYTGKWSTIKKVKAR